MLQYYDFTISKSTTCDLTICDLIDTQSAPSGSNEITYDLTPPASQAAEFTEITSIEVSKFNACDDSFTEIDFTILPLNEEVGTMTYNVSIGTGSGGSDEEQLIWANAGISADLDNITSYQLTVTRGSTVLYDIDFDTPSTTHTHTFQEVIGQNPSVFQEDDEVRWVITYSNGVTTTGKWDFGSVGAGDVGDPSDPVYDTMTVDSSNVYTLDASDCLELITDLDSFGDWDGIWSVRLKVNYTDASGNARHIITTRCAFVDCDNECDAVKEIAELLSTDPDKATELAFTKQMLEWAMDCHQCCAACDALYLYNNRIKGNCKSC
jgi:hypothetical protein